MKTKLFLQYMGIIFSLCFAAGVGAQEGRINFGKLKIVPTLTVEEVYDDNIYLSSGIVEPEEDDWITHIKPGVAFSYTFPERGALVVGYRGDFAYYGEHDMNTWQSHEGYLSFNYAAPAGLIMGIEDTFLDTADPYGSANQYKLGTPNTERWNNDLNTKVGYNFSNRFRVLAYYNHYIQSYDLIEDKTQDYDDNEFGGGVEIRLLPKTWVFVRYHYGYRDFSSHPLFAGTDETNDADFDWHRVNMGLTWDSGAKLSGEVNFGYGWYDYDNLLDPTGGAYDDKGTWLAKTAIDFAATPKTTLSLSITRALRAVASDTREYYEDTSIYLGVRQIILPKLSMEVNGLYSRNDYTLPVLLPREHDNYEGNIALDYQIRRWLKAGIGYKYMEKNSNYIADEYTDNQVSVSVTGTY
jgi:hypothetical protein